MNADGKASAHAAAGGFSIPGLPEDIYRTAPVVLCAFLRSPLYIYFYTI